MTEQTQDDQLEHTYSSYVRIRDLALKTCQRRWMIGRSGERGSRIFMPVARHDDDVKVKVDNAQQTSKYRLCRDRNETINNIRKCSKQAQKKYKTRHEWAGKAIHLEWCKKLKFGHTINFSTQNPEFVQENKTRLILRDFEVQTDRLISAKWPVR